MSKTTIKVENVSKLYRLGNIGTGSLQSDIKRWWWKARGKGDPFAKVGAINDRTQKSDSDYIWALKDVNFELHEGSVLGIIGKNGAGKSTLLKILSKTTAPTTGSIKINGRIASLLEVGTGFHPELTGRENTYLNGAILGMTRQEVQQKFDSIVEFAGVSAYIDTPVKRYSSGMYVRLAFSIAAHLEPEILVVDEVLAVGDGEFRKKAIEKMKSLSKGEGRTVIFVGHSMSTIQTLCNQGLYMDKGSVIYSGDIHEAILKYTNNNARLIRNHITFKNDEYNTDLYNLNEIRLTSLDSNKKAIGSVEEKSDILLSTNIEIKTNEAEKYFITYYLKKDGIDIMPFGTYTAGKAPTPLRKGINKLSCILPKDLCLQPGEYSLELFVRHAPSNSPLVEYNNILNLEEAINFNIERRLDNTDTDIIGTIQPPIIWENN